MSIWEVVRTALTATDGGVDVSGRGRLGFVVALALVAGASPQAAALGATTIGKTSDTPTSTCGASMGTDVLWQAASAAGSPSYVVPAAGVITSWSTDPSTTTNELTRLEVIRLVSSTPTVVAESQLENPVAHNTSFFPTDIPVQAGDLIGLDWGSTNVQCTIAGVAGDSWGSGVDNGPGNAITFYLFHSGDRVNVAAVVTAPPTSTLSPSCSQSGAFTGGVVADAGTTPKAFHYRIDGGLEQVATTDPAGSASISAPQGQHTIEYWGEDQLGQQEATHHTAQVTVQGSCSSVPPHCNVPQLKGKTRAKARKLLSKAHCALGRVKKPKHHKGKLVVKAQSPAPGTVLANGASVSVKLGPKPHRKKRH
jgi:hypothetical protein